MSNQRYNVMLTRERSEYTHVVVTATNEDEAEKLALAQADDDELNWNCGDLVNESVAATAVEEL